VNSVVMHYVIGTRANGIVMHYVIRTRVLQVQQGHGRDRRHAAQHLEKLPQSGEETETIQLATYIYLFVRLDSVFIFIPIVKCRSIMTKSDLQEYNCDSFITFR
jgi:hypothetical protein